MNETVKYVLDMLLSTDEQTFILGLNLLINIPAKDLPVINDVNIKNKLQHMSYYYDFVYKLDIVNCDNWDIIKAYPINEKFVYSIYKETYI